jgi:hypothetical protein
MGALRSTCWAERSLRAATGLTGMPRDDYRGPARPGTQRQRPGFRGDAACAGKICDSIVAAYLGVLRPRSHRESKRIRENDLEFSRARERSEALYNGPPRRHALGLPVLWPAESRLRPEMAAPQVIARPMRRSPMVPGSGARTHSTSITRAPMLCEPSGLIREAVKSPAIVDLA